MTYNQYDIFSILENSSHWCKAILMQQSSCCNLNHNPHAKTCKFTKFMLLFRLLETSYYSSPFKNKTWSRVTPCTMTHETITQQYDLWLITWVKRIPITVNHLRSTSQVLFSIIYDFETSFIKLNARKMGQPSFINNKKKNIDLSKHLKIRNILVISLWSFI